MGNYPRSKHSSNRQITTYIFLTVMHISRKRYLSLLTKENFRHREYNQAMPSSEEAVPAGREKKQSKNLRKKTRRLQAGIKKKDTQMKGTRSNKKKRY